MAVRKVIIFGAAALGLIAFGGALIVTAQPDLFSRLLNAPQCRLASAMGAAVAPFATGNMAAFTVLDPPPDVSALPYDGTGEDTKTLGELPGRVHLVNLWATWCAPCRVEMPHLAALHASKSGKDFAVVGVSIDTSDAGRPEEFLAETGAQNLDYHREPTLRLFNSLREAGLAYGMPTTLLLSPEGCAAGVLHGAAEWHSEDASRLIDAGVSRIVDTQS